LFKSRFDSLVLRLAREPSNRPATSDPLPADRGPV